MRIIHKTHKNKKASYVSLDVASSRTGLNPAKAKKTSLDFIDFVDFMAFVDFVDFEDLIDFMQCICDFEILYKFYIGPINSL